MIKNMDILINILTNLSFFATCKYHIIYDVRATLTLFSFFVQTPA